MRKKVVLLVEDNPDDSDLALRAFRKSRLLNEVVVARDGVEALDYLFGTGSHVGRDPGVLPELVLLDLNLPRISGLEVLQRIRADDRLKLLPVVVLTTSDEEQDKLQSYLLHANSYIRKPVNFDQFRQTVEHLSLYWLVMNEPPPAIR